MFNSENKRFYEVWGATRAQNASLKGLVILLVVLLGFFILRPDEEPLVIDRMERASVLLQLKNNSPTEKEIINGVRAYLEARYTFTPESAWEVVEKASIFLRGENLAMLESKVPEDLKIAAEKSISQWLYPYEIVLVDEENKVLVRAHRVLNASGALAVTDFDLEISFELGKRTEANPYGLFVTSEKRVEEGGSN